MSGSLNSCEAEYAKDSNIKPEDVRSLMEWLDKEPHMPEVSEYQVIQFYHACRYSLQRTKLVLELHYNFKNEAPEFFSGRDFEPSKYDHSFWDLTYCFDFPKPTSKAYRAVYVGLKDTNPAKYNFQVCATMSTKAMLTLIMEQGVCPGYSIVLDYKGFSFSHLAMLGPMQLKKFSYLAQETCQMRMKEIHLINGPGIVDKFLMIIKPFLKKEIIDSIFVHSDINTFFDHIGKDNVPIDMGGTLPQTREELSNNMKKRVDSLSTFVQAELDKRVNETLRSSSQQNDFSISCGSFKRISID